MERSGYPDAGRGRAGSVFAGVAILGLCLALPATADPEDGCTPGLALVRFEPGVLRFPDEIDQGGNVFVASIDDAEFSIPQLRDSLDLPR